MSFVPYPYQIQVADLLLSGKNVILQAPTGAGKTHAAILPLCEAVEHQRDFPHKCLYAVPMRVLANQFVAEYGAQFKKAGRDDRIRVSVQTGEQGLDPDLSAALTFATIDQVLSSFLLCPYGLSRRKANVNAGAVAASYLVFDEFHLFDPISTLPTTLEMLRILRGVAPFMLMTATFSTEMLDGLADALDAVVVPSDADEREAMQALPSQKKVRRYHAARRPLSAEAVLAQHDTRTLVICNVVQRAQQLFESLRAHPARGDTNLLLLHSRFLPEDRERIETRIEQVFGRNGDGEGKWILVATQAVEVGVDITCQTLHTELAPVNSILQRAGRCARYEDEEGDVYVYAESDVAGAGVVDLRERVMPYSELRDEFARTWEEMLDHDGAVLGFPEEQEVISSVHGPRDRLIVDGLVATQYQHRRKMNRVMDGERSGEAGDLIRLVSSKLVVVHDEPDRVLERPFAVEAFGLHPGTVFGLVEQWLEQEESLALEDWNVRALRDLGDEAESGESSYCWQHVSESSDVAGAALVLVDPALAGYDPDLGFVPNRGTGYRAGIEPAQESTRQGGYGYKLETYAEHVRLVYQVFLRSVWPELSGAATRLEQAFGWPSGVMERAAHLVVLLHDAGKLNRPWQAWVAGYQRAIGRPAPDGFYAHTDSEPSDPLHEQKQKEAGRKPPHAAEGAVTVAPWLAQAVDECEPVFNAAFTAIARHHGAFTRGFRSYALARGADEAIAATLEYLPPSWGKGFDTRDLLVSEDPVRTGIADLLVDPGDDGALLAYALLARSVRRADQSGTELGSK